MLKTKINIGYLLILFYIIFTILVFASTFSNGAFLGGFAIFSGYFIIPLFMLAGSFVPGDDLAQVLSGSLVIFLILIFLVMITRKNS